ncbi:MAG TPA: L-rhamnose mutarotase, partial [Rectinema sp.]|nr:L-rhamnose mutarotase [Rectinema sp.]
MKRYAFVMQLKPGNEAEYKRRHDEIWPELKCELRKAGISNYSIYLDPETLRLFAIQ